MNKSQIHEFDEYKDSYESEINDSLAFAGQEHDFYLKLKANHLLGMMEKRLSSSMPVELLDVGCGHGLMHRFLQVEGIKVSGCDPAATVIEKARQRNPEVSYAANDGHTLPYQDNSFDVSTAICVMHHVPPNQWPSFLDEMRRVTRPGGFVAIYEHNPYNPVTSYIVNSCPLDENATLLSSGELNCLMQSVGLADPRTQFIAFFPFKNRFFRFLERLLGWLPLGAQYVIFARVC